MLFGIGDCAQADATEGFVLRFPSLGRGLVFELAAGALVDLNLLRRALVEPPPQMGFQLMISRSREAP